MGRLSTSLISTGLHHREGQVESCSRGSVPCEETRQPLRKDLDRVCRGGVTEDKLEGANGDQQDTRRLSQEIEKDEGGQAEGPRVGQESRGGMGEKKHGGGQDSKDEAEAERNGGEGGRRMEYRRLPTESEKMLG